MRTALLAAISLGLITPALAQTVSRDGRTLEVSVREYCENRYALPAAYQNNGAIIGGALGALAPSGVGAGGALLNGSSGSPVTRAPYPVPQPIGTPMPQQRLPVDPLVQDGPSSGRDVNRATRDATGLESAPTHGSGLIISGSPYPQEDRDQYEAVDNNETQLVSEEPVSTFSIDVDTASYSNVRRFLSEGSLPPTSAVRIEEMVNYFRYDYAEPTDPTQPFSLTTAVYPTPWNDDTLMLHVGLNGLEIERDERPPVNLTFLVDVSGSMNAPDKLPLVQTSLCMLAHQLNSDDRIALTVYAGAAGTVLPSTPVQDRTQILNALDRLRAGGSTAGAQGIRLAYDEARQSFDPDAVNRVILATDGDFNVGLSNPDSLEDIIARERESGVFLTILGVGRGNLNDQLMQRLSQAGNGVSAYLDSVEEAERVLVDQVTGTLVTIASDVKIQIEFNPAVIAEYRLIGYETRLLAREDFDDDAVDAGDIGAGHQVTALYEITPVGSPAQRIPPLRYASGEPVPTPDPDSEFEFAFLRLRYKLPGEEDSTLIERPVSRDDLLTDASDGPADIQFALAVASFGQWLRQDTRLGDFGEDALVALAHSATDGSDDRFRLQFVELVERAVSLR